MNVEMRGRAAAEGLRSVTAVNVEAGLSRLRRTRRRRDLGRVVAACAAVVAIAGGILAIDNPQRTAPPPVKDPELGNGPIINAGERQFGGVPTLPSERPYPLWQAVDPTSGAFLYASEGSPMVVVDETGTVADIECVEVPCDLGPYPGNAAFGPGEDELTVTKPEFGESARTLVIVGYDGGVREEIDLSHSGIPEGSGPSFIAWSPDGRQLAMALDKTPEVWILAEDGSGARLVHREEAPRQLVDNRYVNNPDVVDLAWSPDGSRLGILVANDLQREEGDPEDRSHPLPRLIVVPAEGGGTAQTLHTFDFRDPHGSVPSNYNRNWAFAWSPDGTRIAVTNKGGIAEISATDGTLLAEHQGVDDYGPLTWLPG